MVHDGRERKNPDGTTIRDELHSHTDRLRTRASEHVEAHEGAYGLAGLGAGTGNLALQHERMAYSVDILSVYLQTDSGGIVNAVGGALCDLGLGAFLTVVLYLAAMYLLARAGGAYVEIMAAKDSKQGGKHMQGKSHKRQMGMNLFGAITVGGLPSIMSAMGFSLFTCIQSVPVFGAGSAVIMFAHSFGL